MMVKSPEQLEDAAIADTISTAVGIVLRDKKRRMENDIRMSLQPEVDQARLNGRSVNLNKLFDAALKHARSA